MRARGLLRPAVPFVAGAVLVALAGCATQVVELWPDGGAVSDGAVARDGARDSLPRDTLARRDGAARKDRGADQRAPDQGSACVCRYARCRSALECETNIGPGSVCQGVVCSGAAGSCRAPGDCGSDPAWVCTTSAASTTPCP